MGWRATCCARGSNSSNEGCWSAHGKMERRRTYILAEAHNTIGDANPEEEKKALNLSMQF